MIRRAFLMKVNPDCHKEYQDRHNPIWKELHDTLKSGGVLNYSIFLDEETSSLFGYVEITDPEKYSQVPKTEICQKWWAYMTDVMPTNPDNSPVSKELKEVFHID